MPQHRHPRIFYRVVRGSPPKPRDFVSNKALGKRPRQDELTNPAIHDGVSVSDGLENMRSKARALGLGHHIARLEIPEGAPIRVAKTLRDPHHYTLWGEPQTLLACVVYPLADV